MAGARKMVCMSGCVGGGPADFSAGGTNAQRWREKMQRYGTDHAVGQLMLVRYTGGSSANVFYYIKNTKANDAWELGFEEHGAYVGKYGIGKTREGDAKTPVGDYQATKAFGILPNPGTAFPWIDITPTTYSCDEDCEYYNQIIDTEKTGHACTGEEMYAFTPEYHYGLVLNYNESNTYPKGSAIYLHCKGAKAFTGGCVAISQRNMKCVLKTAAPGFTVCIGEDPWRTPAKTVKRKVCLVALGMAVQTKRRGPV